MKRRGFLQSAAGLPLLTACGKAAEKEAVLSPPSNEGLKLYWGDIHTHCNITYGHGSMEDALEAAVQQLDFCAIVAHALWPDIPGKDDPRLAWVIDYHVGAFERIRKNWTHVQDLNLQYHKPGKFLTILAYECHDMKDGDHNVYNFDPRAPIVEATSIPDLKEKLKGTRALVIPHHMAYMKGYRGFNWDSFTDGDQTPIIEIYSRHGWSETDIGPYPMLHDMGPRSHEGTTEVGLKRGYKFGMMASTDQHAGYPGSYGDGRIAVYARELTMEGLWEAFLKRRVYGSTGEKIVVDFRLNDAWMGEAITGGAIRNLYLKVEGNDILDYVQIVKNGRRIEQFNGPFLPEMPEGDLIRAKVRIEWGWGKDEDVFTEWNGALEITDGRILEITPCFRGLPVTAPQKGLEHKTMVNRILEKSSESCTFHSYTIKNPNTLTPTTNSIVLDVEMPKRASIRARVNGKVFEHTMAELLEGARSHFLIGWLSEAISFHRAIPESGFIMEKALVDRQPENETDYYYARVRQRNNQWAWSSPIWVQS
ncbi:MAG TPA: Tat pathway signal sequence [archaeon]|nr:Tat pathway signal sequence [archaeon]